MKTYKVVAGFLAILGFIVLAAPASAAVDWTGTWTGSIDTGGMGTDTLTLVLKKSNPTYTGTINDSLALIEKDTVISEVKLNAGEISFSFKAVGGSMDLAMKMSANGDTISAQLMNTAVGEWGSFESIKKK